MRAIPSVAQMESFVALTALRSVQSAGMYQGLDAVAQAGDGAVSRLFAAGRRGGVRLTLAGLPREREVYTVQRPDAFELLAGSGHP